ncbi:MULTISPECIES: hypothetical protein [Flavobacterium]|uniref:hypothetical protein n=1 Tax=Flavobacterium TaxID=237 RepID=UPI0022274AEE|nr:hypothetical protein [Flavobacterium sp. 7A]MCW2118803.1 hypothetical protein [Flavobacterium sp. 7A]
MKNIKHIVLAGILVCSCSGDGADSGGQTENKAPSKVSSLTYPTNNLLCISNTLDFQWEASSDPDGDTVSYVLEVSKNNQFSTIDQSFSVSGTTKTVTLEKGVAYYWRVKAKDSKNLSSDFSPVYKFYTEGIGAINHLPFSPDLIFPVLNLVTSSSTVNLRWNASDVDNDALKYDVYLGTSNPPLTKVGENQSINNLIMNLNAATNYYWQVVVKDGKGGVTIGQVWNFKTN